MGRRRDVVFSSGGVLSKREHQALPMACEKRVLGPSTSEIVYVVHLIRIFSARFCLARSSTFNNLSADERNACRVPLRRQVIVAQGADLNQAFLLRPLLSDLYSITRKDFPLSDLCK